MLLIIIALLWLALLTPMVVRRFRDNGTEKSIEHFHLEHEVLSRQEYAVAPAHRLEARAPERVSYDAPRRPRLTVVHEDDTYRSLETRNSWDEWSEDYDYDLDERRARRETAKNQYAPAYADAPRSEPLRNADISARRRSMKMRRRVMFTRLVLAAIVVSVIAFVTDYSLVTDLAVVTWIFVVGFVALALYAVSQGYLLESSLGVRLPQRRDVASVKRLYGAPIPRVGEEFDDEFDSEFYDPASGEQWRQDSHSQFAVG